MPRRSAYHLLQLCVVHCQDDAILPACCANFGSTRLSDDGQTEAKLQEGQKYKGFVGGIVLKCLETFDTTWFTSRLCPLSDGQDGDREAIVAAPLSL